MPSEAGFVEVGVKRKMEYNRSHRIELIDPNKIFKVLEYLKACGNPYYQNFNDFHTYEKRCRDLDAHGHELLFGQDKMDINIDEDQSSEDDEEDDNEEVTKDTIRKHQFDHNRNTAMTNTYPEMSTDDNGRKVNGQLFFAPAEGNCPTNLQEEKDWDIKTWPALLADGRFGLHFKRKVRLTEQQYFCQRIAHRDTRFSR